MLTIQASELVEPGTYITSQPIPFLTPPYLSRAQGFEHMARLYAPLSLRLGRGIQEWDLKSLRPLTLP